MRNWVFGLVLAACSRSASTPASLDSLIVPDATSILAWRPTEFPLLLEQMPDMYRCWRTLETKLEAAYQVFVPTGSYAILVGDLPRADVEKCGMKMLVSTRIYDDEHDPSYEGETLPREGAFTVAPTKLGLVYAAWRDGRIVAGRRADVERALATHAEPTWLHGEVPAAPAFATSGMIAISAEPLFSRFVGVPTTRWKLALDTPAQPWPERKLFDENSDPLEEFGRAKELVAKRKARAAQGLPPEPEAPELPSVPPPRAPRPFTGRLELEYATPADAARAGQVIATRACAIPLEENLAAAFAKLPQSVAGSTLTLRFAQDSFPGVELERLQAWLASLQAQAH